jgi:hypothetical protein
MKSRTAQASAGSSGSAVAFGRMKVSALGLLLAAMTLASAAVAQQEGQQAAGSGSPPAQASAQPTAEAQPAAEQKPPAPAASAAGNRQGRQTEESGFRPRLPNFYAQVVTAEQRQKIYDIQRKYFDKIEALRKQLEALIAQRDAEIEAVLTPEQKAKIEQLRKEASERRGSRQAQGQSAATQQ